MLRLSKITKIYKTSDSKVEALKGIDLCFRKNEFVSILGPSGCGKTTTLNIIGGLDHYSDGDLFINGRSTKDFSDHDWDIYRNHRIGFVFQSYNLIPQENILENVELALAIGGMSKQERNEKAKKALDQVGLKDLYYKKPNQLSGGQCQRVAIARALVNEPDILLADEPTGALDSITSIQIMDLIKKISKEKLVIMVTHNPDIAEKYSTRIIRLIDGRVTEDSNPYSVEEENKEYIGSVPEKDEEKAAMSWWTAFKLSGKNLIAKRKRTILTIIASSIGIVGISAVLAVSYGVKGYIANMQDDMLSGNPISVAEYSFSLSSLLSDVSTSTKVSVLSDSWKNGKIDINFMTKTLVDVSKSMDSSLKTNLMTSEYESYIDAMPESYYAAISKQYGINVKNNLYTDCQVALDSSSLGDRYSISAITSFCATILENARNGEWSSYSSMIDSFTEVIGQSLDEKEYVLSQYDIIAGTYPEKDDEMVLVLNHSNEESDFIFTLLGFYGQDEFTNALYHFAGDEKENKTLWENQQQIAIETILNKTYYYYPNNSIFTKNDSYNPNAQITDLVTNPSAGRPFEYSFNDKGNLSGGLKMKISGIIAPKEDVSYGCYSQGLYYTPAFAKRYIEDNYNSEITTFIREYLSKNESATGYSSSIVSLGDISITSGIGYQFSLTFEGESCTGNGLMGSQSQMSSLMGMLSSSTSSGSSSSSSGLTIDKMASLSLRDIGGNDVPGTIEIYPNTFNDKYLVTDYLDKWNSNDSVMLKDGTTLTNENREEITYTDDLQLVISLINGVIDIVTIALVCFTALSLVVSTVMIGIITYVSVMERVKEIGVIRSLGGRKKDVSHLFNAETFMIGMMSGVFGIAITYLIELILNLTIGSMYNLGMIANLPLFISLVVIFCSILLTVIAGLLPSRSAANQDPVAALRSE